MIYAIRAVGTEFIKFGRARHVGRRLVELDQACPLELEPIATADWPNGAETLIHRLLRMYNRKGEWFTDCKLARQIIHWMGEAEGLAELRAEAKRSGVGSWTEVVAADRKEQVNKRRLEREVWWRTNGARTVGS